MTDAQRRALDVLAAATEPVALPPGTGRVLHERGYIKRAALSHRPLWEISDEGRALLDRRDQDARFSEADMALSHTAKLHARRVVLWMLVHERLGKDAYEHDVKHRYASHVIASDFDAVEPAQPAGTWHPSAVDQVVGEARAAARIVKSYDDARVEAAAKKLGITVSYDVGGLTPKARRDAAAAAREGDGVVTNLLVYRERRPDGGAA